MFPMSASEITSNSPELNGEISGGMMGALERIWKDRKVVITRVR